MTKFTEQYMDKYPGDEPTIFSILYKLGEDAAESACKKAIQGNKRVEIENDDEKIDLMTIKIV